MSFLTGAIRTAAVSTSARAALLGRAAPVALSQQGKFFAPSEAVSSLNGHPNDPATAAVNTVAATASVVVKATAVSGASAVTASASQAAVIAPEDRHSSLSALAPAVPPILSAPIPASAAA